MSRVSGVSDSGRGKRSGGLPERVMSPRYVDKIVDKSIDLLPTGPHTETIESTKGTIMFEEKIQPLTMKEWLFTHELVIHVCADQEDQLFYARTHGSHKSESFSGRTAEEAIDSLLDYIATDEGLEV